ncbi:hypothetical protein PMAYCL1PPCAC_12874, partial [Pristionchus mayeri]
LTLPWPYYFNPSMALLLSPYQFSFIRSMETLTRCCSCSEKGTLCHCLPQQFAADFDSGSDDVIVGKSLSGYGSFGACERDFVISEW